ncbi:hypothetical protein GOODEAATRI_004091 [Goodea atripinnis]|uniref:ASD1 domain-containing protein n=1 Tax=Goodea atripinnis TaxID=208336 RepID=A0ABV0MYI6_9TELE
MSPAKSNNSMEHLGGGKRDSAYSSLSTTSSTPDYSLSRSNAASSENVAYKAEDSPGSRHSTSSRTSFGPVWNVPEKKKSVSPPPPLPPARSDSFAATKAHEKGMVKTHSEGSDSSLACKGSFEIRRSHNISPKNDSENIYFASDKGSHTQFSSNKQYSFYNSDVGQQQVPHVSQLFHPRQHNDKSTFHPQNWSISVPKPQNLGGYHCSSQEPSTNSASQHSSQNHRRSLSTSLSSTTTNQTTETTGPNRYYCVTTSNKAIASSWSDIPNDRRGGTGVDPSQTGPEQTATKVKYHLPQLHQHSSHNKDSNAYSKHPVTTVPKTSVLKHFSDDGESQRGHSAQMADPLYTCDPPKKQSEQRRSLPAQLKDSQKDIRLQSQMSNKICPQTTPMLHSLSMNVEGQEEKPSGPNSEESLESKQVKCSERFATTLRNEIQMRRAKLQKSKSAAALPGAECEAEDQDSWKSTKNSTPASADGSFSNFYKDHLKEAQAKVLKATSFRRRDLEPVLLEHSAAEAQPNYQSSAQARKDGNPLATVTESGTNHSTGHVTRIGSRKRFPTEKKHQRTEPRGRVSMGDPDHRPQQTCMNRFSDNSSGDCKVGEKPAEIEIYSTPPPLLMTGANPDCRQRSTSAATRNHKSMSPSSPIQPGELSHTEPPSGPGKKPSSSEHPEINSPISFTNSQSDVLTQCSSNFEPNPTSSAKTDSEQGKGLVDKGQGAVHHPSTSNPQPASSPPASSYGPLGLFSMEGQRSPSPQFSPQRLSDKPPVSFHDDESNRVEHLIQNQKTAARKVPIRIVHSEGIEEKENSPFLQQSPLPHSEAEDQSVARFSTPPALGQDSVFCAFTRQREPENTPDTEMQQAAQREPYMTTVEDHSSFNSEEPSSRRETTGLSEKEDQKREELARDIMGKDKSLADILDQSKMMTTMDLMEGIFPQEEQLLDGAHQRRKVQTKQTNFRPIEER